MRRHGEIMRRGVEGIMSMIAGRLCVRGSRH